MKSGRYKYKERWKERTIHEKGLGVPEHPRATVQQKVKAVDRRETITWNKSSVDLKEFFWRLAHLGALAGELLLSLGSAGPSVCSFQQLWRGRENFWLIVYNRTCQIQDLCLKLFSGFYFQFPKHSWCSLELQTGCTIDNESCWGVNSSTILAMFSRWCY